MCGMTDPTPPYELVIRTCTIDAGRYRWEIRQIGRPVQSSMESLQGRRHRSETQSCGPATVRRELKDCPALALCQRQIPPDQLDGLVWSEHAADCRRRHDRSPTLSSFRPSQNSAPTSSPSIAAPMRAAMSDDESTMMTPESCTVSNARRECQRRRTRVLSPKTRELPRRRS